MISVPGFLLGRGSSLAIVALFFVLLSILTVVPAREAFVAQNDDIQTSVDQLAHDQAVIDSRPVLETILATVRSRTLEYPGLMRATGTANVAADMQSQIKQIVESNKGEMRSSQSSGSVTENGLTRVSVDSDFTLPATHLKDLLYATETHEPFLFIGRITINAPFNWQASDPKAGEPIVEVRWTVDAYSSGSST